MKQLASYLSFIFFAVVLAASFGALHNQLSYSVAPEYFTHFKFRQFHLENSYLPDRLRASIVGIRASWWMGIPLGALGGLGLFSKRIEDPFVTARRSLLAMLACTSLASILGLAIGFWSTTSIDRAAYARWYIPDGVSLRRFLCAGYMHNASYLGGAVAPLFAWMAQAGARYLPKQAK